MSEICKVAKTYQGAGYSGQRDISIKDLEVFQIDDMPSRAG